ncbi:MAG: SDR family NAD(P)-dependent oxidoreductase [Parasphingorhabdus sp.]
MRKTIFITGSTDGIGLETAKSLCALRHDVILHGRNEEKFLTARSENPELANSKFYQADLSKLSEVISLAGELTVNHPHIDVLINNAGVFHTPEPVTSDGFDVRFIVNVIAPYLLSKNLLPLMPSTGRIINLSSAAQAPVQEQALIGQKRLSANEAYAQSKLGITMWSRQMAEALGDRPAVIAVNPGSFLGTKMVKEGYGMDGKDISIGSDALVRLALDETFASQSGRYFDNDIGAFGTPHPDAMDPRKNKALIELLDKIIIQSIKRKHP